MAVQGVCIAFDDPLLEPSPTWTRLDTTDSFVSSFSVQRGRRDELEQTGTGTASINFNDTAGLLDPTNPSSPYWNRIDSKQAALAILNPVTNAWSTIFRGFTDEYDYTVRPSQVVTDVTVPLVDAMDYLASVEMYTAKFGNTLPAGVDDGNICFLATSGSVDTRIIQVLDNADWPTALRTIFSGNVTVQQTVYPPRSNVLQVLQDCADAEFPGVANVYVSRDGKVTFHGRLARFDPEGTAASASAGAWNFTRWKAGDGAAILADPTTAQIRELSFSRPRKNIINSARATPQTATQLTAAQYAGQLYEDATSQDSYGLRSWSAENLVTNGHVSPATTTALAETKLFATYYVNNYKNPRTRVNRITFKSLRPDDPRAAATWDLICGVEISDVIELKTTHPGGGGFNESFFVEGVSYEVTPLQPDYQMVVLTVDVSPAAYYKDGSMFS
jgi:hypothetical protein